MADYSPELQDNTLQLLDGVGLNVGRISATLGKGKNLTNVINNTKTAVSGLEENYTCGPTNSSP